MRCLEIWGYILVSVFSLIFVSVSHGQVNLYVALNGENNNPGTRYKPLADLEGARQTIRQLKKDGLLKEQVTVWVRGGIYGRTETFVLSAQDSGTQAAPIVYRAYINEEVRLVGGRQLDKTWFVPVVEKEILERQDQAARGKVLQLDLKAHGIGDYGQLSKGALNGGSASELFVNNRRMPLARWPNKGWARCGKIIDKGSLPRWGDKENRGGIFVYEGDRPVRWVKAKEVWLHGYWFHDWADEAIQVAKIDTVSKQITMASAHTYGLKSGQRYYALNLLEEIDEPGEWYLDRQKGVLYFWPPEDFAQGEVLLSLLKTPMVTCKGASHVTLQGMVLEATGGSAVTIEGGEHVFVAGCVIRNIGVHGVILTGGRENGVVGCDIYEVGSAGIRMSGGQRKTLTPAGLYAVNNHIHHFARRKKTYQPAVGIGGVGNRMAHNLIHNAPHAAVLYGGNEHIMEYNEIHDVCLETSDVGVLYCGRDWTIRGNVVRYNYVHHVPNRPGHGSVGVYLDDCASSTEIFGNVFYKTSRSAFIGGGRDNVVKNNIFVECDRPIHLDTRGLGWAAKYQEKGGDHRMYEKLAAVNYDQPPWSTRYPRLARILQENPHAPLGNMILNNVSYRSSWSDPDKKYARLENNFITQKDPGFVDTEKMNFQLRDDSIVFQKIPGFQKIPFEKIGIYLDEYRISLPGEKQGD